MTPTLVPLIWYRVAIVIDTALTTNTIVTNLYQGDSTTPLTSQLVQNATLSSAAITMVDVGPNNGTPGDITVYFDDIRLDDGATVPAENQSGFLAFM